MTTYHPQRSVYGHRQDNAVNCGRASAQMVIASLVLGPATPPSPAEETTPIPFTQCDLRLREQYPNDDPQKVEWRTHPDELEHMVRNSPELPGHLSNWRLSVHSTLDELLGALVAALADGKPAILNVYSSDHWVVVIGVGVDDATSTVLFIEVLDPLPQLTSRVTHTYVDNCSSQGEGLTVANIEKWDLDQLGTLQLMIGNVPPPAGLTDYHGKYVALVHRQEPFRIPHKVWRHRQLKPLPPLDPAAHAPVPPFSIDAALEALNRAAGAWRIPHLTELLAADPSHSVALVRDIFEQRMPYYLVLISSKDMSLSVVGVFDPRDHAPLHFRFTRNPALQEAIRSQHQQTLWWTNRPMLPTLGSPYFPFLREVRAGRVVYTRLYDSFGFELDRQL